MEILQKKSLIIDDHKIIRVGLKGFIHLQPDMEVW